ncbi:hypothetical protein CSUI_001706 [Cystoisospora suis]|uniref:Uncharacterized protein n=1 Tax=Cystoisospora suis TaxID=483139 RepID=A0A2C6LBI3_9APIC|nr:hypothetical protein CSUI_001706 [Cystoisospora suis]
MLLLLVRGILVLFRPRLWVAEVTVFAAGTAFSTCIIHRRSSVVTRRGGEFLAHNHRALATNSTGQRSSLSRDAPRPYTRRDAPPTIAPKRHRPLIFLGPSDGGFPTMPTRDAVCKGAGDLRLRDSGGVAVLE